MRRRPRCRDGHPAFAADALEAGADADVPLGGAGVPVPLTGLSVGAGAVPVGVGVPLVAGACVVSLGAGVVGVVVPLGAGVPPGAGVVPVGVGVPLGAGAVGACVAAVGVTVAEACGPGDLCEPVNGTVRAGASVVPTMTAALVGETPWAGWLAGMPEGRLAAGAVDRRCAGAGWCTPVRAQPVAATAATANVARTA